MGIEFVGANSSKGVAGAGIFFPSLAKLKNDKYFLRRANTPLKNGKKDRRSESKQRIDKRRKEKNIDSFDLRLRSGGAGDDEIKKTGRFLQEDFRKKNAKCVARIFAFLLFFLRGRKFIHKYFLFLTLISFKNRYCNIKKSA